LINLSSRIKPCFISIKTILVNAASVGCGPSAAACSIGLGTGSAKLSKRFVVGLDSKLSKRFVVGLDSKLLIGLVSKLSKRFVVGLDSKLSKRFSATK
tara:strand:+ start:607 stop:900 length:294 start_codon:yes stop_codon:yes gene_type:complete